MGIDVAKIIRSSIQIQCAVPVLPAVADIISIFLWGQTGKVRVAARHDEPAAADSHVIFWHFEFHGILVAAVVAAVAVVRAEGLIVQAEDVGAGGDGHFLRFARFDHDVGVPNRRHIVDFLDLSIGGGLIHGDGVAIWYVG